MYVCLCVVAGAYSALADTARRDAGATRQQRHAAPTHTHTHTPATMRSDNNATTKTTTKIVTKTTTMRTNRNSSFTAACSRNARSTECQSGKWPVRMRAAQQLHLSQEWFQHSIFVRSTKCAR